MTRRTLAAALASLAFVSLGLPDGLLGPSWPSIRTTFALPLDALGLLIGAVTAGYLTSSFLSGWILARAPLGSVLAASTAATSAALLTIASAPAWSVLLAACVVAGLGGGAIDAGLNAYGAQHFSNRMLNWLHAFFGLGTTIGPLVATAVLGSDLTWRWGFGLVGAAQAVLAATFLATRRAWRPIDEGGGTDDAVPSTMPAPTRAPAPAPAMDTLRRPVVWLGMALFFLYTGVEIAVAQWSFSLLTLGRGVPDAAAGLFVTAYWGSIMAGRILFGLVADRVPLIPTLRLCLLGSLAGAAALWLGPAGWMAPAGLVLMGLGFAPVFASLISLTPARVGRRHADSAIGFQIAAAGLGAAAVTGLIGVLADGLGLEAVGACVAAGTILLIALHEGFARQGSRGAAP